MKKTLLLAMIFALASAGEARVVFPSVINPTSYTEEELGNALVVATEAMILSLDGRHLTRVLETGTMPPDGGVSRFQSRIGDRETHLFIRTLRDAARGYGASPFKVSC